MGWLLAILSIVFAGLIAYRFATAERWFGLTLFGVVLPGSGLAGWWSLRQPGHDARRAADRMFILFQAAMMSILVLVENSQMREQQLESRCQQRIEAAAQQPDETTDPGQPAYPGPS